MKTDRELADAEARETQPARLVWFGRCLCGSQMAKIKQGDRIIAACEDDGCLMRDNSAVTA